MKHDCDVEVQKCRQNNGKHPTTDDIHTVQKIIKLHRLCFKLQIKTYNLAYLMCRFNINQIKV